MKLTPIQKDQWHLVKAIYTEAFPKAEQKPFWTIRVSVHRGNTDFLVAEKNGTILGIATAIPYRDIVLIDYLAVTKDGRGKGTGSTILQKLSERYAGKRIILQIERIRNSAPNYEQRVARRNFYLKNGFISSNIYTDGHSGDMEILIQNGSITKEEYMKTLRQSLGRVFFYLSKTKIVE